MKEFGCSYGADCTYPPAHYGWCTGHWEQLNRTGMLEILNPQPVQTFTFEMPLTLTEAETDELMERVEGTARPAETAAPTPSVPRRKRRSFATQAEAFQAFAVAGMDCWGWDGPTTGSSKAPVLNVNGTATPAHRWAWEQLWGPVPEGRKLMNDCGSHCPNPAHWRLSRPR